MRNKKRACFGVVFVILTLLLGQRLTQGQEASMAGAAELAEYQNYLPLMIRQVFVESTGVLDPSFDEDGVVFTDFFYLDDSFAWDVAVQPDGKIIVVGSSDIGDGYDYDFALARYNPDGSLDTSFDEDGMLLTNITQNETAYAVALQADGKIVVGGETNPPFPKRSDFALVRYNPDGSLDASFGSGGIVLTDFGDSDGVNDLVILADGKILAAGAAAFLVGGEYQSRFALARYNPDGSLDSSFSDDGMVTTDFDGSEYEKAYTMRVQPDGKILLAGLTGNSSGAHDLALARYNPDGSLDASFDGDGLLTGAGLPGVDGIHTPLALQTDGKILVANPSEYPSDLILVRFHPDGSLDTSFGKGGIVTTDWGCNENPYALAMQPDGKIVAAGMVQCIFQSSVILARYLPDGSLDESFGYDGRLMTDLPETDYEGAGAMVLQRDGKIVLVGMSSDGNDQNFTVLRYK